VLYWGSHIVLAVKELLSVKRNELQEWKENISNSVLICSFIIIPLVLFTPLLLLQDVLEPHLGPMEGWLETGANPLGMSTGIVMITVIAIATLVGPIWLVPMLLDRLWQRQYDRILSLMRETSLPVLIVDDTALAPLWSALEEQPLLRLVASQRPKSIDQRIEFTSDYWRAVIVVLKGRNRLLKLAIFWGNATRLVDDIAPIVYNGCVSMILLVFTAPFMLLVAPIWAGGIFLCTQQQACQAAMVDYFLDHATEPVEED